MSEYYQAKEIAEILQLPLTAVHWRIHKLGVKAPYDESILEAVRDQFSVTSNLGKKRTTPSKGGRPKEINLPYSYYQVLKAKKALHIPLGDNNSLTEENWKNIREYLESLKAEVDKHKQQREEAAKNRKHQTKPRKKVFGSRGIFYDYIPEEDLLPLSKALERGFYNENGTLNVFKDTTYVPKELNGTEYFKKFLPSRGYIVLVTDEEDGIRRFSGYEKVSTN